MFLFVFYWAVLFRINDTIAAWNKISALVSNLGHAKISFSDHFILVNFVTNKDETYALRTLEKTLMYYNEQFGLLLPEFYIVAYFTDNKTSFVELSNEIHGLQISPDYIGYSNISDFSIVALDYKLNAATQKHELLHILINYNCQYLEPWLAEGVPSLYEVSSFENGNLNGRISWRNELLDIASHALNPDEWCNLKLLINMNWAEFNNDQNDPDNHPIVNQALARVFAMYLQEIDSLGVVFSAYKERDPLESMAYDNENNEAILETILQKDIETIQSEFMTWFRYN